LTPPALRAEVVLDGSLGPQGSIDPVDLEYHIPEDFGSYSSGYTNLFHSFSEFSIEADKTAKFTAAKHSPQNLIVRVTLEPSLLQGVVDSSEIEGANLFILNPYGIEVDGGTFNVRGSVHLATADVLKFKEGEEFYTDPSQKSCLSAMAPSAFGFLEKDFSDGISPTVIVQNSDRLGAGTRGLSLVGRDTGLQAGVRILGDPLRSGTTIDIGSGTLQIASAGSSAVDIPVQDLAQLDVDTLEPGQLGRVVMQASAVIDAGRSGSGAAAGSIVIRGEGFQLVGSSQLNLFHDTAVATETAGGIDVAVKGDIEIRSSGRRMVTATTRGEGADIRLRGENVTLFDGVELNSRTTGGVGGDIYIEAQSTIELQAGSAIESFGLSNTERAGDITLNAAAVEIHNGELLSRPFAGIGGDIRVTAQKIALDDGARITSQSEVGADRAGDIRLGDLGAPADSVVVADLAQIASIREGAVGGGDIQITAVHIEASGGARIASQTATGADSGGEIKLGSVDLPADSVLVTGEALVTSVNDGAGSGAAVAVTARKVALEEGGEINTSTTGAGSAGNVTVRAERVEIRGWEFTDPQSQSGIGSFAAAETTGGQTGNLEVFTKVLDLQAGGRIQTDTFGQADAGDITIKASERVTVQGGENRVSTITAGSSSVDSTGDGGKVTIGSPEVGGRVPLVELLDGGRLTTTTSGTGTPGALEVWADRMKIAGRLPGDQLAGLFSKSQASVADETGLGGSILVDVRGDLVLADAEISTETRGAAPGGSIDVHAGGEISLTSAKISASASGTADAGQVLVQAGTTLTLAEKSEITTDAAAGAGGQLTVQAGELVYVVDSTIETKVAFGSNNGGDILIDPDFVVLDNGDVIATAQLGDGGAIKIVAGHLFQSSDSDIDPTSKRGGLDGELVVEPPETEVVGQLTTLEASLVDASSLLTTPCAARTAPAGSFVVSSRAPRGASPDAPLSWIDAPGFGAGPASCAAPAIP
jgi:filamentous hemagglutinin family protein